MSNRATTQLSFPPRLIRASAGSGKTRELSSRYIGLLARGESPDKILATTFTRKAATEIRERVFTRLAQATLEAKAAKELGESIGLPSFSKENALELLERIIKEQHRLQITTLDGLFISIAQSFALELGLPADWRIASNLDLDLLNEESVRKLFEKNQRAVSLELVRCIHLGNSSRAVHEQVLGDVTSLYDLFLFSSEAAWKWLPLLRPATSVEWQATIEALNSIKIPETKDKKPVKHWLNAVTALRSLVPLRKWNKVFENGLINKVLEGETTFSSKQIEPEVKELIESICGHARVEINNRMHLRMGALYDMLGQYHQVYQENQGRLGILGFSDVKQLLARSAVVGNLDHLYYRLDSTIKHILLDEFQDTSMTEWRVLEPIVAEILSKEDDHSFFCVGDVKQAIYAWRGGVAEIFGTLEKKWPHLSLESNQTTYRCSPAVIEFVNRLFTELPNLPSITSRSEELSQEATKWGKQFIAHQSARTSLEGCVQIEWVDEDDCSLFDRSSQLVQDLHRQYPEASIGILVRDNKSVSTMLRVLAEAAPDLEISEEGGNALIDSRIVRVILSLLRYIEHPTDTLSFVHLKVTKIAELIGVPKADQAQETAIWREKIRRLIISQGYGELISKWVSGIISYCAERDKVRLRQLVDLAFRCDATQPLSIDDFYNFVKKEKVEFPSEAQIRVMTIHKSKGLEFDIVIVPIPGSKAEEVRGYVVERTSPLDPPQRIVSGALKLEKKLIPEIAEIYVTANAKVIAESFSLYYVAYTRARQGLYIVLPEKSRRSAALNQARIVSELFAGNGDNPVVIGNPSWSYQGKTNKEKIKKLLKFGFSEVVFKSSGIAPRKNLEKVSPSLQKNQAQSSVVRQLRQGERLRGTILHAFFEQIEWIEDVNIDQQKFLDRALSLGASEEQASRWFGEFNQILKNHGTRQMFSRERYQSAVSIQLYREVPFAQSDKEQLLVGTIDRLVIVEDKKGVRSAELIDLKSDQIVDLQRIEEYFKRYLPQLELYKQAVIRLFGEDLIIKGNIFALESSRVIELIK